MEYTPKLFRSVLEDYRNFFSKGEKKLINICITGICICVFILFQFEYLVFLSESPSTDGSIGSVIYANNDTRYKSVVNGFWRKASVGRALRPGDSIFTGDNSGAKVELAKGGYVDLDKNSLVVFSREGNQEIPDFRIGNFSATVNGELKIKIRGQTHIFNGRKSKVQIVATNESKPKILVLDGKTKVSGGVSESAEDIAQKPSPAIPSGLASTDTLYHWKLYDFYKTEGGKITQNLSLPTEVGLPVRLSWRLSKPEIGKRQIRFSSDAQMHHEISNLQVAADEVVIQKWPLNKVFWQVRGPSGGLSEVSHVEIKPNFLPATTPWVSKEGKSVMLSGNSTELTVPLIEDPEALGYLVEVGHSRNFSDKKKQFFWSNSQKMQISFFKTGTYYYRTRLVNLKQEISEWGESLRVQVVPEQKVITQKLAKMEVFEPKIETRTPTAVEEQPPQASQGMLTEKIKIPEISATNAKYNSSFFSMYGFFWAMQSTSQFYSSQPTPIAGGGGVKVMNWWGPLGLEIGGKTNIFSLNQAARETDIRQAEARFHYRILTPFPLNLASELQISAFGGVEVFQNSGTYFSKGYNLGKLGTAMEFPWKKQWQGGGEFVYGIGLDGSNKKEVSGHVNYFLNPRWTFGMGYRIHLFEARSAAASANGTLPYREGYTEGYSILDFHY